MTDKISRIGPDSSLNVSNPFRGKAREIKEGPEYKRYCCDLGAAIDRFPNTPLIHFLAIANQMKFEVVIFKDRGLESGADPTERLERLGRFFEEHGSDINDFVIADSKDYQGTKAMTVISDDPDTLDIDTRKPRRKGGFKESVWGPDSPHIVRALSMVGVTVERMTAKGFPSSRPQDDSSLSKTRHMLPANYDLSESSAEGDAPVIYTGLSKDIA